ncbi:MAG TPA: glucose-6-phosphate dehydrogenase [Candidatus Eisenbacteria bacterium]|jgi:glucose-6-phosphate 1-dehydrogenase
MSTHVAAVVAPAARPAAKLAPPCAMVIFGATGDLTRRKLVPALYNLARGGLLPERFAALGLARRPWSDAAFRDEMSRGVSTFSRLKPVDPAAWEQFAPRLEYVEGSFDDPQAYERLAQRLETLDRERGLEGNRIYYLAVPPAEFPVILHRLKAAALLHSPGAGPWSRVILEKPFGRDLESARALNALVARVLDESQSFRIDHYLGKETVQNILVFRFANSIFEPLWNRSYVDYVEICATETVGVETRGKFYEQTGVLRDIVQNHLLEVLSLTAMEPPTTGGADDIRGEKLKVLHALREPWDDTVERDVVLGQYRGYRAEPDVAPDSVTPTFAALRVFVDNWRWQGVPFYLRTGKKMAKRVTEVSLHMRAIPLCLFGRDDVCERIQPNVLTLRIQPDEGIALSFASKVPGLDLDVGTVAMDMRYLETFGGEPPEAYERLLLDAMRGDATLFSRRDAVEASWAWITPILEYFERHPPTDFPNYEPGSWGPVRALELMRRDRRAWREL